MYNKVIKKINNEVIIYLFFKKVKVIMDICAIVCEFNPFHNGHRYILNEAKRLSGCDAVLCIMSGSFTQRGEPAVLNKFERAKHAIENGADVIIEIPTPFAISSAEIFARGAISILSKIPSVKVLAFGAENANEMEFINAANILTQENALFKETLKNHLDDGESYIKSYCTAFETCGGKKEFLSTPNNVLGVEYAKAIRTYDCDIKLLPVNRVGCGYNDINLCDDFSSASAIRGNLENPSVLNNVPYNVKSSLKKCLRSFDAFKTACLIEIIRTPLKNIANVVGCTEGLENRIKNNLNYDYDYLIAKTCGKRYSQARIKRILCANLLGVYRSDVEKYLASNLFIKPLAINDISKDAILSELSLSKLPIIIKKNDERRLCPTAVECYNSIIKSDEIWSLFAKEKLYNFTIVQAKSQN